MHLALKSAMSRIPYTNKVGETLSSIADPAAAYSLRALGGGDPTVARVRRSSDDAEKDFTASDMDSGSVANWVNEQLNLTSILNPLVVGSHSDWLYTAIDDSNYDIEAINNSVTRFLRLKDTAFNGNTKYRFTFDYTVISGTSNLTLSRGTPYQVKAISEGFNSIELDLTADSIIQFRCANGATFKASIRNITVTAIESDGFVTTWYDQSGNSNDATQSVAASQPKIVDGGVLQSGLKFNGSNSRLDMIDIVSTIKNVSTFLVCRADNISQTGAPLALSRNIPNLARHYTGFITSNNFYFGYAGSATEILLGSANTNTHLFSTVTGETTAKGWFDGSLGGTTSAINAYSALTGGGIGSINITTQYNGSISEIIVYDSDQSANRAAIETNINNYYDIY